MLCAQNLHVDLLVLSSELLAEGTTLPRLHFTRPATEMKPDSTQNGLGEGLRVQGDVFLFEAKLSLISLPKKDHLFCVVLELRALFEVEPFKRPF